MQLVLQYTVSPQRRHVSSLAHYPGGHRSRQQQPRKVPTSLVDQPWLACKCSYTDDAGALTFNDTLTAGATLGGNSGNWMALEAGMTTHAAEPDVSMDGLAMGVNSLSRSAAPADQSMEISADVSVADLEVSAFSMLWPGDASHRS